MDNALAALFAWSLLAATCLPVGSEAGVVLAFRAGYAPVLIVAVATVGNVMGCLTNYGLGRWGRTWLSEATLVKAESYRPRLDRWAGPALFFSWLPFVGDAAVLAAGLVRYPLATFTLYSGTGRLIRYAVVVWVAQAVAH